MRELSACCYAAQREPWYRPGGRRKGRKQSIDTLEGLSLVERYGSGWRPTKLGVAMLKQFSKRWDFTRLAEARVG
jgi:hypothetical protein